MANQFMGAVLSGGFNYFLTYSSELDPNEVVCALADIGARGAAEELKGVLAELGVQLQPSSEEERWQILDRCWTETLDQSDMLSAEGEEELAAALAGHVAANEYFYLGLTPSGP